MWSMVCLCIKLISIDNFIDLTCPPPPTLTHFSLTVIDPMSTYLLFIYSGGESAKNASKGTPPAAPSAAAPAPPAVAVLDEAAQALLDSGRSNQSLPRMPPSFRNVGFGKRQGRGRGKLCRPIPSP